MLTNLFLETKLQRAHRAHQPYSRQHPYRPIRTLHLSPSVDNVNALYPTMTTPDESSPEYKLVLGHDGWNGGNRNFRVVDNVIKIKKTDADPSITPSEEQRHKMYDSTGNFSQHVQLYRKDGLFQLWMHKIGRYVADWVLDKRASNDRAWLFFPFSCLLN